MARLEIDSERCKGCEYCINVCPKGVLGISEFINTRGYKPVAIVRPDMCTGCALCAIMCPDICIEVWK